MAEVTRPEALEIAEMLVERLIEKYPIERNGLLRRIPQPERSDGTWVSPIEEHVPVAEFAVDQIVRVADWLRGGTGYPSDLCSHDEPRVTVQGFDFSKYFGS